MSARTVIDALEFVRSGRSLRGGIEVGRLGRLVESLHDTGGTVSYALSGRLDGRGRPQLSLEISGALHLQCQRCLGRLDFPLRIENTLLVLGVGEEDDGAGDDPLAPETVDGSADLDVDGLIEDEILLGIPFAPRHPEGECSSMELETHPQAQPGSDLAAKLAAWKKQ